MTLRLITILPIEYNNYTLLLAEQRCHIFAVIVTLHLLYIHSLDERMVRTISIQTVQVVHVYKKV